MDAVLPLKIDGGYQEHDLVRARMLVFSLGRFWEGAGRLRLHIISPRRSVAAIRESIESGVVDVRITAEEDLVPALASTTAPGWYRQQALKLAAHRLVPGEFFLTLDADILCLKTISEAILVPGGKALTDWVSRRGGRAEWWNASAQLLGVEPNLEGRGIDVTPAILSRQICAELAAYLSRHAQMDPWAYLLRHQGWSEYTIYNIFAGMIGRMESCHHPAQWMQARREALHLAPACHFWNLPQFVTWNPSRQVIDSSPGYFTVCQSNTRIPPKYIFNRIEDDDIRAFYRQIAPDEAVRSIDMASFVAAAHEGLLGRRLGGPDLAGQIAELEKTRDFHGLLRRITESPEFLDRLMTTHGLRKK